MLLLADENFPLPTVSALRGDGHDILWARVDAPGAKDTALLEMAELARRLILTLDKDFWQIALQRPEPIARCGLLLFRVHPAVPDMLTPLARRAIEHAGAGWRGQIHIVTIDRIHLVPARSRH
jgi:predicted nuclease of predicted toxin-antitoxin system